MFFQYVKSAELSYYKVGVYDKLIGYLQSTNKDHVIVTNDMHF